MSEWKFKLYCKGKLKKKKSFPALHKVNLGCGSGRAGLMSQDTET